MNNKSFKYLFFDLDGTIINSQEGIFYGLKYSFEKMKLKSLSDDVLVNFIGPPLLESYMKYCNLTLEQAKQAYIFYREAYNAKGIKLNKLYDGIENVLQRLNDSGKKLILATSKPEPFAKINLDDLNVSKYFTDICGASLDDSRTQKYQVIEYALKKNNIVNVEDCIMIGDRSHDVEGAALLSMKCIGVLYGFGSLQELEDAGAVAIAEVPEDILKILRI